ncbi:MAG: ATP phosphoribosyltransferase regulatory subunit [Bacilli bacterium]
MGRILSFEKPIGMRDLLTEDYALKKQIEQKLESVITTWGYQFVQTPTLEYYETIGKLTDLPERELFKLLDHTGRTLVLRPDLTVPMARLVSSQLAKEPLPLRLAYCTTIYRSQTSDETTVGECGQVGVEIIGAKGASGVAESISLLDVCLRSVTNQHKVITIGHETFVRTVLSQCVDNEELLKSLKTALSNYNFVHYRTLVGTLDDSEAQQMLLELLNLHGTENVLSDAFALAEKVKFPHLQTELTELCEQLVHYNLEATVQFDFRLVKDMNYYTGIIFEAAVHSVGQIVASGGSYDELYAHFGVQRSAVGFAIYTDNLLSCARETEEKSEHVVITYAAHQLKSALETAEPLRQQNIAVTLMPVSSWTESGAHRYDRRITLEQEVLG